VYPVLGEFEKDGLAWSEQVHEPGKRGGWKRVYHATALAEQARVELIETHQPLLLVRADIRTWVAFARPQDAPRLLVKLEEYELDCMEMLEQSAEAEVQPASWHGRAINLMRGAISEQLKAELRWITRARREIEKYLAQ
jgi:DNA-binding PadR family transcriptional regulator